MAYSVLVNEATRHDSTEVDRGAASHIADAPEAQNRYCPPKFFRSPGPHEECAEEKAGFLSRMLYLWATPCIAVAANGDLPRGQVQPISLEDTAFYRASHFFDSFQRTRRAAHTWDAAINSPSDLLRRRDDTDSRGVLRWVGTRQQSSSPNEIVVGVEWLVLPKKYQNNDNVLFCDGTVDGEKKFTAASERATVELPGSLCFVQHTTASASPAPEKPSVLRALLRSTTDNWYRSLGARVVYEVCFLSQPAILQQFVLYVSGKGLSAGWSHDDRWLWGAAIAMIFIISNILQTIAFNKFFHLCMRSGLNSRSALMAQLFHKALTIAPADAAHPDLTVGRVVNMMSSDVERINELYGYIHYTVTAPLKIIVCTVQLYSMIGWIVFASIALTLFTAPLQGMIMQRQFKARNALSSATDQRLKATNELFSAVRVIKYMGWERSFVARALRFREIELAQLKKIQYYRVATSAVISAVPTIITATVFILYHTTGHTLTPEVVFPVMALLNIMRFPIMIIPMMLNFLVQASVSVRRLNRYLGADDFATAVTEIDREESVEHAIVVRGASFGAVQPEEISYRAQEPPSLATMLKAVVRRKKTKIRGVESAPLLGAPPAPPRPAAKGPFYSMVMKPVLSELTLTIPKGKFTVIVGATGSGKSLLLEAVIGFLVHLDGSLAASKSIAYVPQQPWIMNATVVDNIIFFSDFDQDKFNRAVVASSLERDLQQLPDGARTEIGERGVNLSGGQRARVALARAVYAERDVYLLDDPLAAVDAHVSSDLVSGCFLGALRGKTRVLVTHQRHVLPLADHVVCMDGGRVVFCGSYEAYKNDYCGGSAEPQVMGESAEDTHHDDDGQKPSAQCTVLDEKPAKGLMTTEERATGHVPLAVYRRYIDGCGGIPKFIAIIILFTVTEVVNASVNVWIALWSSQAFGLSGNTYLYVYVGLLIGGIITSGTRAFAIYDSTRLASRALHRDLLNSVSEATMSFFDTTPLGRILNRFAKDVDTLDNDLPMTFLGLLNVVFSIFSSSIIMLASQPIIAVPMIPAAYVYSKVLVFYNKANREIKRVDSINKSPVFALLSEVLEGTRIVAAFGKQFEIIAEALRRIDCVFSTAYLTQVVNRWLGIRLDALGSLFVCALVAAGVVTYMLDFNQGDIGLISLGVTIAMNITQLMNWLVRSAAAIEAEMNSIERITFYITNTEREDFSWYREGRPNPLPVSLPSHLLHRDSSVSEATSSSRYAALGIELKDVCMRYRPELPLVLSNVSFTIAPSQKVGIVGRTGSGKSTLLMAFLRIVEISNGAITINGVDQKAFALEHLRALFAMIPQEPVLFAATVRYNLDPFDDCSDEEICDALRQTGMLERVTKDGGINSSVMDGGKNYSVGQRQLLCMARALLKRGAGFILMDEATANIDAESDALIHRTVRMAFADRTVITIAHRLATVMDSDLILVMDSGNVKEMGAPRELAARPGGLFRSLLQAPTNGKSPALTSDT